MPPSWLFLDIGNVLLIDERFHIVYYEEILHALKESDRSGPTFHELMLLREKCVREDLDGIPHRSIGRLLLGEEGHAAVQDRVRSRVQGADFLSHQHVVEGARSVLQELSDSFHIAIAANQPSRVRTELERLDLLSCFDLTDGISDDLGLSKPDRQFYLTLLERAACEPEEAIMIGDRIDNDIAPAHRVGMKTVLVDLSPEAQGLTPRSEADRLYIDSLHRAPSRGIGPGNQSIVPSVRITSIRDLPAACRSLASA